MTLNLDECDVLVFDIEGTVCPISFVKDVLPPLPGIGRPYAGLTHTDPASSSTPAKLLAAKLLAAKLLAVKLLAAKVLGVCSWFSSLPSSLALHRLCPLLHLQPRVLSSIFPYALEALPKILDQEWDSPEFAKYRDAFPEEYRNSRSDFEAHVRDLVKRDVKIAYLKSLQGYLWLQGYESGDIVAPLFPDVDSFFNEAVQAGKKIIIYSSGSVPAQKLLFAHTNSVKPDMTPLITDYFDTTNAGPKAEVDSYTKIVSCYPEYKDLNRWLFLSDNIDEVTAAVEAGIRSLPVVRLGNMPLPPDNALSKLAIAEFKHSEIATLGA
ncbi:hypothetical protein FZEAL_7602 [Fusarium zealandicum]|uniref:Enolase-phosphatase E1 n=1 Tax=Fusarium zealandicum TaxID=1053134 RepID=A0A8H4XIN9_9HYPO|nr:hypothetical protein FZEAL_7602 [Fusarium zealandicum]